MEAAYWHEKWAEEKIGFHQSAVNKRLVKYWPEVTLPFDSATVLVPLCGKSLDMLWLHEQGHSVVGVELSQKAANAFFVDNNLQVEQYRQGDFEVYSGQGSAAGITIMAGDFFSTTPELISRCTAVYDRASLIALPGAMRGRYADHLASILSPGTQGLLLSISYDQEKMSGPPFSVTDDNVRALLGNYFALKELAHYGGPERLGNLADRGLETLDERVYLLTRNKNASGSR